VQASWDRIQVPQCGYCQSGQVMAATALLTKTPNPTDAQIEAAMNGNICRCGTYGRVRTAIKEAAKKLGGAA
jgi:isoquinoline 1-oxidoreductase alpha subunit